MENIFESFDCLRVSENAVDLFIYQLIILSKWKEFTLIQWNKYIGNIKCTIYFETRLIDDEEKSFITCKVKWSNDEWVLNLYVMLSQWIFGGHSVMMIDLSSAHCFHIQKREQERRKKYIYLVDLHLEQWPSETIS